MAFDAVESNTVRNLILYTYSLLWNKTHPCADSKFPFNYSLQPVSVNYRIAGKPILRKDITLITFYLSIIS
jgi:hypothetical protein